jgi:transposase
MVLLFSSLRHSSRPRSDALATATPIRITEEPPDRPARLLACALGAQPWKRGGTTGAAQRPRERQGSARHLAATREEIGRAQARVGWPAAAPVISGDEAGRDGVWLRRGRVPPGVATGVVAASRMAVHRRHRRAQTARRDGPQWRPMLLRHAAGARKGWRSVRVPRGEAADRRQRPRACTTAQRDRPRGLTRLQGLHASHGRVRPPGEDCSPPLAPRRRGDAPPLPAGRHHRLGQEGAQGVAWTQRLAQVAADRRGVRQRAADAGTHTGQPLRRRTGMGSKSAWRLVRACFGGRALRPRQAGGAWSGLPPTP